MKKGCHSCCLFLVSAYSGSQDAALNEGAESIPNDLGELACLPREGLPARTRVDGRERTSHFVSCTGASAGYIYGKYGSIGVRERMIGIDCIKG